MARLSRASPPTSRRASSSPVSLDPEYIGRKPERPAPGALLAALDTAPLPQVLAGLEPADPDYRRMVARRPASRPRPAAGPGGPRSPTAPTLHPGETDPRVAELRARLARLGYLVPSGEAAGRDFDPRCRTAVEASSATTASTPTASSGADARRGQRAGRDAGWPQVAVNLERMRWMNRATSGARYLFVNIPDFTVRLIEDGRTDLGVEGRRRQDPRHRDAGVLRRGQATWWSTRPGTSRTRSRSATTCRSCRRTRWC